MVGPSLPPPIFAANGWDGDVHGPQWFMAGEAGSEHVRITPTHTGASGGGTTVINIHNHINPQVQMKATITGVEKPDEVVRKIEGAAAKAKTIAIENYLDSSKGRKKIDDIATQSARKVSGV